jgi:site-specific DNA recombinase
MRAALYTRVSTKDQIEGYSLRDQVRALREHAKDHGYEIVAEIEDAGYSAAYLERPGMDRVRDLVAAGGADVVLAQDADRITREPGDRPCWTSKPSATVAGGWPSTTGGTTRTRARC